MSAKQVISRVRAPGEQAAEERAWAVVRSAYEAREPIAQPRSRRSFVLAFAVALGLGAVALSPAGATVGRLITRALGVQHASPALSSLPASGRLLVSGPAGTWTVAADGAIRRLGPWPQANWSPHGLYVAAVSANQLAAINPRGVTQWRLARPSVSDPRWYSPSGLRVAYLSAGDLRVVAGDGSGDHLLAAGVAHVAPAWRPAHAFQLAYLTQRGRLVVRGGDTGRKLWSRAVGTAVSQLEWSGDGRDLVALSPASARLYGVSGTLIAKIAVPAGTSVVDGALSPNGRLLALVLGGTSEQVVLANIPEHNAALRRVLAGPGLRQVMWSPDARWLLVSWPEADQLVFIRVVGTLHIAAVSHIARQFSAGGHSVFPLLEGWCCTARGPAR